MNNTNTGGPAFPVIFEWGNGDWVNEPGMTLRDYFAAKVLQGLLIDDTNIHGSAKFAYEVADAMLNAREQ